MGFKNIDPIFVKQAIKEGQLVVSVSRKLIYDTKKKKKVRYIYLRDRLTGETVIIGEVPNYDKEGNIIDYE